MVDEIRGISPFMQGDPRNRADAIKAQKEHDMSSIFGDNKVKTFQREVNGVKQEIYVGKNTKGEKVRYVADENGHLEELVATDTTGKNKYVTKNEMETEVQKMTGMTIDELKEKGVFVQCKHGSIVFTDNTGTAAGKNLISAMEQHKQEVARDLAQKAKEEATLTKTPEPTFKAIEPDKLDVGGIVAEKKETPDNEKDLAQVKTPAKKPKSMHGQRAIGPEVEVIGDITAKARKEAQIKARNERLEKTYPQEVALNDKRMGHISGDTYMFSLPKPQGNGRREPAYGYDMYTKVKAGNKEIFLRNNLTAEQKQKVIDAELAKQKAEAEQTKTNEAMQAKRNAIINKGKQAGKLVGITPDKVLDKISTDVKSLNASTVRNYMDGYKQATGNREMNNFFHKLWVTSHYGKNEAQWKREKLDIMNKILSDFSKTPGAKEAKFEKTIYKAGKPYKVTLTLDSVMKELQQAKANMQKGIPVDETIRDVERIMSRFGYGNANA